MKISFISVFLSVLFVLSAQAAQSSQTRHVGANPLKPWTYEGTQYPGRLHWCTVDIEEKWSLFGTKVRFTVQQYWEPTSEPLDPMKEPAHHQPAYINPAVSMWLYKSDVLAAIQERKPLYKRDGSERNYTSLEFEPLNSSTQAVRRIVVANYTSFIYVGGQTRVCEFLIHDPNNIPKYEYHPELGFQLM